MTYPKAKLTPGVDAAGAYLCGKKTDKQMLREVWWDGRDYWWDSGHNIQAAPEINYTNFRPLAPAPEVVEGPAELTIGKWLILDPYGKVWSAWERVGGDTHERVESGFRAIRIDAWLAALTKPEPKPVKPLVEGGRLMRLKADGSCLFTVMPEVNGYVVCYPHGGASPRIDKPDAIAKFLEPAEAAK